MQITEQNVIMVLLQLLQALLALDGTESPVSFPFQEVAEIASIEIVRLDY
jgi:hypothetical protein